MTSMRSTNSTVSQDAVAPFGPWSPLTIKDRIGTSVWH